MTKHLDRELTSNTSDNPSIDELIALAVTRRQFLRAGVAGAVAALPGTALLGACATDAPAEGPMLGFVAVAPSTADKVVVPPGYRAQVLYRWGDPVGTAAGMPAFKLDAGNTAEEQALQAGMHHDAIEYFPLPRGTRDTTRGLLALNHEYTDDGLLHPDGLKTWSAEKVRKAQAAHGVSVIEVERAGAEWRVVRPSPYARRVTASTPMRIAGPVAGSAYVKTNADPTGTLALGTFNNCAGERTPWGTYLTCEENFNGYFGNARTITAAMGRYGIRRDGWGYRWHLYDPRFDVSVEPNELNRFGWIVEIDPYDPRSMPVKRTALGRFKHEGAMLTLAADGRVVVYSGDDEGFEYVYKFMSRGRYDANDRAANRDLLDQGTLYVARFGADGKGEWRALRFGDPGLAAPDGFENQADVLVRTRMAADGLGATKMDRPEWLAVHPRTKDVYCALTNNSQRGAAGQAPPDAANPRARNVFGHIIRWREAGGDPASVHFDWDIFVLAGDPSSPDPEKRGTVKGDGFGSPDGLRFDDRGVLWIQTDVSGRALNEGDYARLGNNQMLAADVTTGEIRRFLVGPSNCEITGLAFTPGGRTMFVNIQHPGETPSERSDPANPRQYSNWPDYDPAGRPRSATLAITKDDGGAIGA
jgi:secreted PhoX family phosphatase